MIVTAAADGTGGGTPLVGALQNVASELSDMARASHRLQSFLGHILSGDGPVNAEYIHELQAIDLLCQSLQGTAEFVRALSAAAPTSWRFETGGFADRILLSDLRQRLEKDNTQEITPENQQKPVGDFELFGDL